MAVVADWSQLPKDLLNLISERIDNKFDFIRFRSVCSSWRSFSIPNHHHISLPFKFPNLKYKRNIFLIKAPQQQDETLIRPWLIRVTQNSSGKIKLYESPLISFELPSTFSFSIDLYKSSVHNLGTDFIFDEPYIQPEKVLAVTPLTLAILLDNGQLVLSRCGDDCWTGIPDVSSFIGDIGDICIFKERIYAVEEKSSKTVTIGPEDLSVKLVAKDVHGGRPDIQFMVESEGELLLVDVFESFTDLGFQLHVDVDVFRIDEKEKEWVKLKSLGDRVLFWGNKCSFSASASDLSVAKGNCVIFMENVFFKKNKICDSSMCVFDLDQGRLLPLRDYPDYLNLFWPPPPSIVKSMHKTKKRAKERNRT
ncbi:unnamed protein product [Trifolium pratense]|uniref:Uncharacterized protein n=1 Tax=Trifolium pratense TaxID=57577 RepID=A0ACB0J3U7_TRIPR|nr:unnamed protein product [Trifolium pratense]